MQGTDSLEKTLILGGDSGQKWVTKGWDGWMDGITNLIVMSKVQELVQDRESWHDAILGVAQSLTQFSDWTAMELLLESNEIALKLAFWAFFK